MSFAPILLQHLEWFAPAAAIVLLGRPGVVVLLATNDCFVRKTLSVLQVQGSQLCLVIAEELLQGSDFDVILTAHDCYFCICK